MKGGVLMSRKWTENSAVAFLLSRGISIKNKIIISEDGLRGLSSCSARDYLVNYCGYKSNL